MKKHISLVLAAIIVLISINGIFANPLTDLDKILALQKRNLRIMKQITSLKKLKKMKKTIIKYNIATLTLINKSLVKVLKRPISVQRAYQKKNLRIQKQNIKLKNQIVAHYKRIMKIPGAKKLIAELTKIINKRSQNLGMRTFKLYQKLRKNLSAGQ